MDLAASCFGEVSLATALESAGTPIIPEVALLTRELVIVFEADLVQPKAAQEEEA